ncbi:putative HTH-type transcriptional regulator YcgK [Paenibacillus baekrokdamisoli]|uniref:Putative HTH-type transcriptional regulator YcgK n=1 Tax=Paenibacillus baekrokdamisoli TaxID=1712516 RepID=A0A3G9J1F5_9BACL|nr:LysR family transcriptional regulator [Paenibacillus baekrokdamisoli]MBB3067136.1 DNA-binding transcriptional LysR family regulator [Paenibacillus baekrokdamisoli]BBH19671.1 putative HTH-type transcriptional regulator YcgK [Paenibacillus baekrokdamisoli]
MEFRQLQYVIQIAKEKNFSRAAEKLHIAQPSLSQQLSKLEKEIGVLLFRRTTNSVELTHAGSVFVAKAQGILDNIEQLKQELDDLAHMRKGKLVVGSLPITGSHVLPLVLPVFGKLYPEIEVVLVEDSSSRLEQLTASGQTDLSLLSLPLEDPSLEWVPIIDEEICLAVPPEHPLVKTNEPVRIADLASEPFIVLKKGQGFRQIAIELCSSAGFEPRIVFESSNIETVQSLVAAGMGIAFVPKMMTRAKWSEFIPIYLPFAAPVPSRTLVIASRKGRYLSKAAEAFIETMKNTVSDFDS